MRLRTRRPVFGPLAALLSVTLLVGCGPAITAAAIAAVVVVPVDDSGESGGGKKSPPPPPPPPPTQGVLDTSFGGGDGHIIQSQTNGSASDHGYAVAIDLIGRILVSGSIRGADFDMMVWRFLEDGTLDVTFNGQGWLSHHDAAGGDDDDSGHAGVAVDSRGRIVVAGSSWAGIVSRNDVAVWRLLDDGTLDPAFNGQGFLTVNNVAGAADHDAARAMTLDGADRILVTGESIGNTLDAFVMRIDVDGALDPSFGLGGIVVLTDAAGGLGSDRGNAIALDADERIVVAGVSAGPGGQGTFGVIWRFTQDGALDPALAGQGFAVLESPNPMFPTVSVEAMAIDDLGRILATGATNRTGSTRDVIVWRVTEDGDPDITFDGKGWAFHGNAAGNGDDYAWGMAIEPSGRILVCGSSDSSSRDFEMVLWRFLPIGSIDGTFGTRGFIIEQNPWSVTGNDVARAITIDGAGRIVVVGEWQGPTIQLVILRYL